jgi:hypothetical protein
LRFWHLCLINLLKFNMGLPANKSKLQENFSILEGFNYQSRKFGWRQKANDGRSKGDRRGF